MTRSEIEEKIKVIVKDQLQIESDIRGTHHFSNDLGADSLDLAEMAMEVEDEFNIEVPQDAEGLETVDSLAGFVESALQTKELGKYS